ncbi:MAG: ANTAR domain-containing protein [Thiomicrorhabdus chilensis]|uniref:ANTAR domain-containing response regulator n=1 Tax=Thiomicrorhabdus chilensis TaxID=63656 RepID=UPI00299EE1D4|nr:ANTAR domain-containing protein [Thiomicrorhabdus chilensis]MDX1346821.1 ANTAR domain-containing protein [Thiomicrorhabdus chilensis]
MLSGLNVLLVCDENESADALEQELKRSGIAHAYKATTDENVLKFLTQTAVDLVVLDVKSPTTGLFEQFAVMQAYCPKPVVCFSAERDSEVIAQSVKAGVTAYIVDGKSPSRLQPILEVAMARFNECQAVKKELAQVKDKLSERAVIEKAKGLLIEYKNMSEDQAYKTMRKMAMDQGKKISVIAHEVCDVISGLSRQNLA